MENRPLRIIRRPAGACAPADLTIELFGEIGRDASPFDPGDAISASQVISWFAEAGAKRNLPTPSLASSGLRELVRDLNLIRCSDDFVSAVDASDLLRGDEDQLWHFKEAIRVIKEGSPRLIQSLMEQKDLTGDAAVSDPDIGPLIRLYEAANARLPLAKTRLRAAAGHTGKRRAPWHDEAQLIAGRAKVIWSTVTKCRLGWGKPTSPVVLFTAKALVGAGLGEYSEETVSKALARRGDK